MVSQIKFKKMNGQIQLITGCMFSGKTTELLRRIQNYVHAEKKCLLVKSSKDTRTNGIKSHTGQKPNKFVKIIKLDNLKVLTNKFSDFDVIGIDEAQFFDGLVNVCVNLAESDKIVIVAGLNGDFKRTPFGEICKLIPQCESITKLNAICSTCKSPASFSKRICDKRCLILLGGIESYVACCRKCFKLKIKK